MRITLTPYLRDYTQAGKVKADFEAEKDFLIADQFNRWDGKPANRQSLVEAGYREVTIYFNQKRKHTVIKL